MPNPPDRPHYDPELPTTKAQELLSKLRRRSERRRSLWNGHVAGFVAINSFLVFIDLVTGGGLWFPYVAGAMAIPLLSHYIHRRRRNLLQQKLENQIEREPRFPDRLFRPFRKLHRSTTHFLLGLGSAATISGYLFLINVLTGGSFWSIIPVASIALPVVFHGLLLRGRRRSLIRTLESGDDDVSQRRVARQETRRAIPDVGALQAAAEHPMLAETRHLEQQITNRLQKTGTSEAELLGGVRELVGEIERLCELSNEFTTAVQMISLSELQNDRAILTRRREEGASETMMRQYAEALDQVERQIAGLGELENRKELLELRIRTGVNSLRQINIDLVRMQGDAALGEINRLVQNQTEELSAYLSDLQQSYRELSQELGG